MSHSTASPATRTNRWPGVTDEFGEQMLEFGLDGMRGLETLVLGRATYEIMAGYWPTTRTEDPFTA